MEMLRFQSQLFQLQFFEKGFRFSENLFQSYGINNVQNFQWLSHKITPIYQKKDYFKNR